MKKYISAPLPFMGQKRRFLNELTSILKDFPEEAIYIDLFGGSGLLSHFVKSQKPLSKVVYNDYDQYYKRLETIPFTNAILADIRAILKGYPKDQRITGERRESILKCIASYEKIGNIDYITLSSSLLFSMNYALNFTEIEKATLYNVVKLNDYNADGYLEGVDRVTADYKKIFQQYKNCENAIFLVDPPYLSTETKTYQSYWKLSDYLDVLHVLDGHRYIYFTSNKSNIIELCDWIGTKTITANPFFGAQTRSVNVTMNFNSTYTDIMLFK